MFSREKKRIARRTFPIETDHLLNRRKTLAVAWPWLPAAAGAFGLRGSRCQTLRGRIFSCVVAGYSKPGADIGRDVHTGGFGNDAPGLVASQKPCGALLLYLNVVEPRAVDGLSSPVRPATRARGDVAGRMARPWASQGARRR